MTRPPIQIAPSILAADFAHLGDQVRAAQAAGAHQIHVDVMDGRFVPNITMGMIVVEALRGVTDLPLDVHLMIVEPERYIADFARAGASTISVHLEASPHLHRTLQSIAEQGCRVGVAINPHSPALLLREVLPMVDLVNVMTVNPGFGGQRFISGMLPKIVELRALADAIGRPVDIEVDGGINAETARTAVQAGANVLVVGTALFQAPGGLDAGMRALMAALEGLA